MIYQSNLEEKIYNDMISKIREYYKEEKIEYKDYDDPQKILIDFLSYVERLIFPTKRKVHYSTELLNRITLKETTDKEIDVLSKYENSFLEGKDMNCFLSNKVKKCQDVDFLLYTWKLFHLHMSGKFVDMDHMKNNRSKTQLLCIIDPQDVYFIDVIPHPKKADQYFNIHNLEIIINNGWINKIGFSEMHEVIPETINLKITNDKDIFELYRNANNIAFELGGKCYMSSYPISVIRRPLDATLKLIKIKKQIKEFKSENGTYTRFQFGHDKNGLVGIVMFKKSTGELISKIIF